MGKFNTLQVKELRGFCVEIGHYNFQKCGCLLLELCLNIIQRRYSIVSMTINALITLNALKI